MPFCHQCGFNLTLGIEKFCPNCRFKLQKNGQNGGNDDGINITDNKGDVIGTGFTGSGNFIGKEIGYTVNGTVINLHVTGNVSKEDMDNWQKIISMSTQLQKPSDRNN